MADAPATNEQRVTDFPTIADPWRPRDERWLARRPSRFAARPVRPLFIGACPRSGTTLLRSLLDNHPELAMPAETDFVLPLFRNRVGYGDLRDDANRRRVADWIFREKGHGSVRLRPKGVRERPLTPDEAVERLVAAPPTLGSLVEACFRMYAEAHGKPRWGDKRPAYAGYVSALFRLFPDAQFVNVVRDPRGAVASLMRLGWHKPKVALAASTATWETSIARVDHAARRLRPDQLLDVRYEDLVRDPAAVLERVCRFANLDASEQALNQMLTGERGGTFRPGWHDRLSEPIDTAPIDNWRRHLQPQQVALVEAAAAPSFARFGYRPLQDLDAQAPAAHLRRLEHQRERRRRKWRTEDRHELKRRLWLYRRPVAAVGHEA